MKSKEKGVESNKLQSSVKCWFKLLISCSDEVRIIVTLQQGIIRSTHLL